MADGVTRRELIQGSLAGALALTTSRLAQPALAQSAAAQSGPAQPRAAQSAPAGAPRGAFAQHVEAVGYTNVDHRPAFKMAIREVRGRWYLYTGSCWHSGWSIVDVTDPAQPRVVNFIPGPPDTWTVQVDLSGNTMVTALEKVFANFGGRANAPFENGVLIWDISDPVEPRRLGHYRTGGTGTHRNQYAGGRYVHLAAGVPGFTGNIYVILDIADPANPREAGRWFLPQQRTNGRSSRTPTASAGAAGPHAADKTPGGQGERDAGAGTATTTTATTTTAAATQASCACAGFCASGQHVSLHGPPYVVGTHAYLPYGAAGLIVLDISDVSRPRQIGCLGFSPPFHSQFGVHGVLPLPEQGIAFVNSEDVSYGKGPAHHASIVDISDPREPWLLSLLPAPVPPPEAPYADFSTRGGWCGPHNINHHQHHPDVQRQDGLLYIAHFNAGLRLYDVSNRRLPREAGYFVPPDPTRRYGPMPEGPLVVQTEDVVVDRRGYIYISHKNQGIWILRYTGPAPGARRA